MEHLDPPDEVIWDERRLWLQEREAHFGQGGAGVLSEQACALMLDLQTAFCAGAWTAAIVLAAAIVDLQSNQRGAVPGLGKKERDWLRLLRNALVHAHPTKPGITMQDQWTGRDRWEKKARRAVEAALAALYPAAGSAPGKAAAGGAAP